MIRPALVARNLSAGYGDRSVLASLDLEVPRGTVTAIVGANASGKSTLLRTMSRLLAPSGGEMLLDGEQVHRMAPRALARRLGLLPQSPTAPEGMSVADLVSRGRHPHHGLLSRWTAADDDAVARALTVTGTADLADRDIDALSGGQRQRVWIAMALAQQTDVLLLDEPTTYLDIAHQIEVLDLLIDLNRAEGITIVMVLHDLNLAARYADRIVALVQGRLHVAGTPQEVLTAETVSHVFDLDCHVITDPVSGKPMMLPRSRHDRATPRAGGRMFPIHPHEAKAVST